MSQSEVIHLQLFEFMPKYLQLKYVVYKIVSAFFSVRDHFRIAKNVSANCTQRFVLVIELYLFEYNVKR